MSEEWCQELLEDCFKYDDDELCLDYQVWCEGEDNE